MHTKQTTTHTPEPAAKATESPQKVTHAAGEATRLPAWTNAWGDHPPAVLFPQEINNTPILQTKLTVNQLGDPYEQEADRVADQVIRMPATETSTVQADPSLMRKESTGAQTTQSAPPIVNQALNSGGQPLDTNTRATMEPRLGQDFSQVRVHTDKQAAEAAQAVSAKAYTVGKDVVFGEGQYAPGTSEGQRLLAHELTHVVQQDARHAPLSVQRQGSCPTPPPRISMQDFIDIVKRIEADNPGKSTLEIEQLIARTKFHSDAWDWLLPSLKSTSGPQATTGSSVTASDVGLLSCKLIVTLPGGGEADPLHIVVGLVAQAETKVPGSGWAGGFWAWVLVRSLPSGVSQGDIATWLGDIGHAAAAWMSAHPLSNVGPTMQDYMDKYAPQSDLLGDVDGVAMSSTSGAFVFDPSKPLSDNLQRFYFPAPGAGKFRRFHIFCAVRGFALEPDGVTLSSSAITTINTRVQAFEDWYSKNDPTIERWVAMNGPSGLPSSNPIWQTWINRANDWQWFARQFCDFVQNNLRAEGP